MPPIPALKTGSHQRWPTELVGRIFFGLFLAQWLLVWAGLWLDQRPFGPGTWPFYGVARAGVNVISNGNVTFGVADTSCGESE